ncbi:hypothetical protein FHL15_009605 [Xylaria flabelliformis]|uniref:Uncharacterized protein n=1 Tax=Xylaria flabelliformis TaxID=2512241 RepID=A0A553HNL5_9PEZI|nr:hypothetical protein FHL15_009605 [Xylaria flabelliformis]
MQKLRSLLRVILDPSFIITVAERRITLRAFVSRLAARLESEADVKAEFLGSSDNWADDCDARLEICEEALLEPGDDPDLSCDSDSESDDDSDASFTQAKSAAGSPQPQPKALQRVIDFFQGNSHVKRKRFPPWPRLSRGDTPASPGRNRGLERRNKPARKASARAVVDNFPVKSYSRDVYDLESLMLRHLKQKVPAFAQDLKLMRHIFAAMAQGVEVAAVTDRDKEYYKHQVDRMSWDLFNFSLSIGISD